MVIVRNVASQIFLALSRGLIVIQCDGSPEEQIQSAYLHRPWKTGVFSLDAGGVYSRISKNPRLGNRISGRLPVNTQLLASLGGLE